MIYADVVVAKRGSSEALTYAVPAAIIPYIGRGRLVTVPVRNKKARAIVVKIHERLPATLRGKVREIVAVDRDGGLSEAQMAVVHELAEQYLASSSDILFRVLQQPRPGLSSKTAKAGSGSFFQAPWPERKKRYRLTVSRYDETLVLFPTYSHLQDFAKPSDIILDGSAKARQAVAAAKPGTVFLGTVGDSFFPLRGRGLVIVDQPDHVGAQYASRPFLKCGDIVSVRCQQEGIDYLFGQALIHPKKLAAVQKKIMALESRTEAATLLVCSRTGSAELLLPTVVAEITAALTAKQKVAVLVASKGWANAYFCRSCRTVVACADCGRPWGVGEGGLHCRYCGKQSLLPETCPNCSQANMAMVGEGIDQYINELKRSFPTATLQVLAGSRKIKPSSADITVGTEKILSFPQLAFGLLVVASADRALSASTIDGPWRLLNTLAELTGQTKRIVAQTYFPEHRVFEALSSGNARAFFQAELEERERYQLPPYGFALRLRGTGSPPTLKRQATELEKAVAAIPGAGSSGLEAVQHSNKSFAGELHLFSPLLRERQLRIKLAAVLPPNWTVVS